MWKGQVVSIHISPQAEGAMVSVEEVLAVPGKGLEGDRYFLRFGTYSNKSGPDREVTLIEAEAIEALEREKNLELPPGAARRNIVTRGVPLNHLAGQDFRLGDVTLRGIRLCEPCAHLEGLTQRGVLAGLIHRGGLRAQILSGGRIRAGDVAVPVGSPEEKTERNKAVIRRYYHEMWNPWNFELANELLAPGITFRGSLGVATSGIAAFQDYMRLVRRGFPDFHNTIEELVAEGDTVVARLMYRGTHQGEALGIAPTGKEISYAGAAIFRLADGKIVEGWVLGDRLSLLQQLKPS